MEMLAHADAMVPADNKTGLSKVKVECDVANSKLTEQYITSSASIAFDLYQFPSRVDFACPTGFPIEFEAEDGITLGQISGAAPVVTINKNLETYKTTIDTMSGAVNVEKQ